MCLTQRLLKNFLCFHASIFLNLVTFVISFLITVGKFKGNQDRAAIDGKELRELLEMRDHEKVVSSENLVIGDKDLKALLDRSDLLTKTTQNKQTKSPRSKRNLKSGLFRVLDNSSDS